jgi:hypothetical protein
VKLGERLAVSKETACKFDIEMFHLSDWSLRNAFRLRSETGLQLYRM